MEEMIKSFQAYKFKYYVQLNLEIQLTVLQRLNDSK